MFSRRPGARFNRGRIAGSAAADLGPALQSDDFEDGSLAAFWSFVDPLEDCSVAETSGEARISLPGSATHDLWENTHTAPRIWQDAGNVDIDVALELGALPSANTELGLIIAVSTTQYYRFGVYADGAGTGNVIVAFVNGGTGSIVSDGAATPTWLRVTRDGSSWVFYRSANGADWTQITTDTRSIVVDKVGIYGRNLIGTAFTARAESFVVS